MAEPLYGLNASQVVRLQALLAAYERGELRGASQPGTRPVRIWSVEFGKPDATIQGVTAFGGQPYGGTVSLYTMGSTGNTTDTGYNVTAYNLSTVDCTTTQWVQLLYNERSGQYLIHDVFDGRKVKDLVKVVPGSSFQGGDVTASISAEYGLGLSLFSSTAFAAGNTLGIFAGSTSKSFLAMPTSSTGGQMIQGQCT